MILKLKGKEMNHEYASNKYFLQMFMVIRRQEIRKVGSKDKSPSS